MNLLADLLSSRTRAELFRVLFGVAARECHLRELQRQSGASLGAVQSELRRLDALHLVVVRQDGNRKYFSANRTHPVYPEIHRLVIKTVGLRDVLAEALSGETGIALAFVFGSVARGEETATSDIDLMVIGDIGLRRISAILVDTTDRIGREINPHVMPVVEFQDRLSRREHLVSQVVAAPKLFMVGNDDEFAAMAD